MRDIANCKIGPLPAPGHEPPPPPPLPDTRESRVQELKAEVKEILKKAGKEMSPPPPLPSEQSDTGDDPADILKLVELRKKAAKLPPIEDVSEFIVKPLVKPKMLIEGILHQGCKMSLGGGSKSFKTWMLMDLGLSVSSGRPWLGFNTTKARVLYCNFEIQPEFMQDRVKAIEKAKDITSQSGDMDIWNLRGYAAPYDVIIPMILERIKDKDYGLIILDPIYKIYGDTDENSASDMAALMNELERLAVKAKAAVVFGAHFSKGNQAGKESIDKVGGSGVYGRDPDTILNFTKHEEEGALVVEADLRNLKHLEKFVVRWEFPLMVRDDALNPQKMKTNISKKAIYTVNDLLKALAVENLSKKDLKATVMQTSDMGDTTFHNLFKRLESMEGVTFDPKTKKYSYTNPNSRAKLV